MGLSPNGGAAPVLELCWDAEAHGGARDEGALGAHGVPQGGLEVCDAEDVEGRQGALGSVGLGAVRHPRGEGGAPLVVQACHGPLDTAAEGARQGMRLTGKKKEIKKIKLNWANPISRYISFQFYSHSYHVQLKAINSLEPQKEKGPIYKILRKINHFVHFLCRELSLTVRARDWHLSRAVPFCLIVKTQWRRRPPQLKLSAANYTSKLLTEPHFHPGPGFYLQTTISDKHTQTMAILG